MTYAKILLPIGLLTAMAAEILIFPSTALAQVVTKTNALASYSYSGTNAFVPSDPLVSASGSLSTFSFLPTAFSASSSGALPSTNTVSAVIALDMSANSGLWFAGALNLNAQVNYSLAAPTATSSAHADFSAPFTLEVTGVDGAPFVPVGLPIATNMTITPPFVAVTGPVAFPAGNLSGSFAFDINTIKAHFGIGGGSNITSMRLQVSPLLTVQSERGSATASLVNFDLSNNQMVPEPSTCALLFLGLGAASVAVWRRRSP